jgi:hypothetical protein
MLGNRLLDALRPSLPDLLSSSLAEIDDFKVLGRTVRQRRHFDDSFESRCKESLRFCPGHCCVVFSMNKHELET